MLESLLNREVVLESLLNREVVLESTKSRSCARVSTKSRSCARVSTKSRSCARVSTKSISEVFFKMLISNNTVKKRNFSSIGCNLPLGPPFRDDSRYYLTTVIKLSGIW